MKVKKNIDIYLTSKRPVRTIDVVQYDTGIQLVFTVKDFTLPSGSSATLFVQKPSGKFVYQNDNITVAENAITISLENQALTEYGEIPYQVSIENGTDTVTTFTGLMNVQRSLKDSGAIKSGTVVRAFDELTVEKLAEFQARAETAANGVIATIPEDYTEMTAKVNESANAIKGSLSGAVVRVDDVSPVEHYPKVKVICPEDVDPSTVTVTRCGKNLLNLDNVTGNVSGTYRGWLVNPEEDNIVMSISDNDPSIAMTGIYLGLNENGINANYGYEWIVEDGKINREYLSGKYKYVSIFPNNDYTVNQLKKRFNIQVEFGTEPTTYEPSSHQQQTPNTDGTINGITSLSPTMTLLTDTEGVTIECEYNKDTNKVISKLAEALGITI